MEEPAIPWSRVAAFVRQYTHDVRNGLHSLDLETALLHEIVPDGEAKDGVGRMRKQVSSLATLLRSVSATFQDPQPLTAPTPARGLLRIWRENHAALPDAPVVQWVDELGDEQVSADVAMIATVFRELLSNASAFSQGDPLTITARVSNGDVVFEMCEPKKEPVDTSAWGQAFSTTRRGRYGMGLWTAHRLMNASGASMVQRYVPDEGCLATRISLAVL